MAYHLSQLYFSGACILLSICRINRYSMWHIQGVYYVSCIAGFDCELAFTSIFSSQHAASLNQQHSFFLFSPIVVYRLNNLSEIFLSISFLFWILDKSSHCFDFFDKKLLVLLLLEHSPISTPKTPLLQICFSKPKSWNHAHTTILLHHIQYSDSGCTC